MSTTIVNTAAFVQGIVGGRDAFAAKVCMDSPPMKAVNLQTAGNLIGALFMNDF
jgi:hypothetical protein